MEKASSLSQIQKKWLDESSKEYENVGQKIKKLITNTKSIFKSTKQYSGNNSKIIEFSS